MQKLIKSLHRDQKGFTLVELMVVVVIIGILVAIAIPVFRNISEKAQTNACHANLRVIDGAVSMWVLENSQTTGNGGTPVALTLNDLSSFIDDAENVACPLGGEYFINIEGKSSCGEHGTYGGAAAGE
jgi:prepilin-type N-terminal cleavage/methylation domain-containing protein